MLSEVLSAEIFPSNAPKVLDKEHYFLQVILDLIFFAKHFGMGMLSLETFVENMGLFLFLY
jgi:hypothetical protein